MKRKFLVLYVVFTVVVLSVTTIGATYAYWTATTQSQSSAVNAGSTIYSISMDIFPVYNDFSFIPMNDSDALKAIKNKCRDKYDRGACTAYRIHVYGYNEKLDFVSGFMNVATNNMVNLSYMMLREEEIYDESRCAQIEDKSYCIVQEASPVIVGEKLSLGSAYDVTGMTETDFILLIWLTNLNTSQNEFDIGSFNATVTMQAGNGGEIKGSIASAIEVNPNIEGE